MEYNIDNIEKLPFKHYDSYVLDELMEQGINTANFDVYQFFSNNLIRSTATKIILYFNIIHPLIATLVKMALVVNDKIETISMDLSTLPEDIKDLSDGLANSTSLRKVYMINIRINVRIDKRKNKNNLMDLILNTLKNPRIELLDINTNEILGSEFMSLFPSLLQHSKLKVLNLAHLNLKLYDFDLKLIDNIVASNAIANLLRPGVIVNNIKNVLTITDLNLYDNSLHDNDIKIICEALHFNKNLNILNLGNNIISITGIQYIVDMLNVNTTLTTLGLSENMLNRDSDVDIDNMGINLKPFQFLRNITLLNLDLTLTRVSIVDLKYLLDYILNNNRKKNFITLNLTRNNFKTEHINYICDALSKNIKLENLILQQNDINDGNINNIWNALINNTNLISIDLSYDRFNNNNRNIFTDKSLPFLYSQVSKLKTFILKTIKLDPVIMSYLLHIKSLVKLDLTSKDTIDDSLKLIGNARAKLIANYLLSADKLEYLNLSYNNITDEGAMDIGNSLKTNKSLKYLNLDHNLISNNGYKNIGEALKYNSTLEEFYMYLNALNTMALTINDIDYIANGLLDNKGLNVLHIDAKWYLNGQSNIDVNATNILKALKYNSSLIYIHIPYNYLANNIKNLLYIKPTINYNNIINRGRLYTKLLKVIDKNGNNNKILII